MCIPPPSPSREGGFLPQRQCPMRRREAERSGKLFPCPPPCAKGGKAFIHPRPLRHPVGERPAPLAIVPCVILRKTPRPPASSRTARARAERRALLPVRDPLACYNPFLVTTRSLPWDSSSQGHALLTRNDGRRVTRPNFAPLGLVRRFVGMLVQTGISPCVNDGEERPFPASSRTNVRDLLVFCHFPGDSSLRME